MIIRYVIVVLGASAIVVALLLAMNEATNRFSLRDPTRYFTISDFIPAPDAGRQLPEAPPKPAVQPSRTQLQYERPAPDMLAIEPPTSATEPSRPSLEPGAGEAEPLEPTDGPP